VPTVKFLDEMFENWTRDGQGLLGPVFLHLDPLADIPQLRAEFDRIVEAHPLWNKVEHALKVTNMTAGAIEVRMVVSAQTAGDLFHLSTDVREGMLAYIREHQPMAIARQRTDAVEIS
jgi:hypothetical protein